MSDVDDEALTAALACPWCLGRHAHVLVNHRDEGGDAMCACWHCGLQWSVALDLGQATRLLTDPPQGLWVRHRFDAGESM